MKKRRQNFLVYRFLCFLMALHVINIGIDTPDIESLSSRTTAYHKDLSINKIESISEFVLETCLGFVDAVPEHDDPDEDSEFAEREHDYTFTQLFVFTPMLPPVRYLMTGNLPFRPACNATPTSEIIAPPPKYIL
ncbi:hypothetical protein [Spirosoma flavum]|uniref:Uncharacterized protein n=1 Tax=Spirosoma flavum TaxID=2048557 RepID=A0ABW6AFT0_9BACT